MKKQDVYIGSASKQGIYYYKFKKGKLKKEKQIKDFQRCTFLNTTKNNLYSVIEIAGTEEEKYGYIIVYDKKTLKLIDKKPSYGQGPCHIEIDDNNKLLFISNYINGYLTIFKINEDGTIGKKIYSHVENEEKSHLHCVKVSTNNRFFFVVDLGVNLIIAYEIIGDIVKEVSRIQLENNTEPRHIVVNNDLIYLISEKSCEIYIIKFKNKKLSIINKFSILPSNIEKRANYTGCAIKISKNHRFLYATIRGYNCINIYRVIKNDLRLIQNISCYGNTPRDLCLDKAEKYLLVANQDSNQVAIFKRNMITGKIKFLENGKMELPTCIIIE